MAKARHGCWSVGDAEKRIHAYVRDVARFTVAYTSHAKARMKKRDIVIPDVWYVLEHGRIAGQPEETKRAGYCKYKICGKNPSWGGREICLIVIPDPGKPAVKIVTVMWKDLR
ncbi:MAG: DUF4258 domain-containing protein [Gammaproteobacteria bacterium]|nr:DUF4258 domain-containing protein [Gammaproteobacteria bacterium]CAJ2376433.1 MAG: conserved hypothetical protein [Arenicellales bacterium IbO2]MDA7961830.1 DUF4258 domain-containing protein [Gammaproteobacteria bacterium]MDA7969574.1 DUF4258 domain-containing protein [Gammaproteobacteria bacterium]MDA7972542.1 DUF4258 domain-containing protein [Gammaproteobacteria bacterium]